MEPLNRNVITNEDVENFIAAEGPKEMPRTLDVAPPSGAPPPSLAPAANAPPGQGAITVPTQDDYLTKLLKYVPPEVIGTYIFLASLISGGVTAAGGLHWWLGVLLVVMAVLSPVYVWRVLNIVRPTQILMSVLGLIVYVFALGGWFATTTWYQPFYGSVALVGFAFLVGVVRLRPLPTPPAQ